MVTPDTLDGGQPSPVTSLAEFRGGNSQDATGGCRVSPAGHLLVIGNGPQEYREQLFASLATTGVWLLCDREPTWQRPYISGYTVLPRLNSAQVSTRLEFLVSAVAKLAREIDIDGVLTFEEMFLPAACEVAESLGLAILGRQAAENCRNKELTRTALTDAGLRQPRFEFVTSADDAARFGRRFGYPVVFKPRGLAGSLGVFMANTAEEVEAGYGVAVAAARDGAQRHGGGALVEEFLDGPEISIDCAVVDGHVTPLFLARKKFGPKPFFEETGQTIDARDPLLTDPALVEMLQAAHTALGVRTGMTHTEVKLTPHGPVIVEVNGRMAGDYVSHLARYAMGLEGAVVAADVARGRPVDPQHIRSRVAAVHISYAQQTGTVDMVTLPEADEHPCLVATGALVTKGTPVTVPPDGYMARCAYAIVVADSPEECETALTAAVANMAVRIMSPELELI